MIGLREAKLREMVVRLSHDEGQKVIREMTDEWDRDGEGCFACFIRLNFPLYWLGKVRRN